jgi:uncharacterized protein YbjQ (UPF0145 family)
MQHLSIVFAALFLTSVAHARDTQLFFPIEPALQAAQAAGKITGQISFYFGDQQHPQPTANLGSFVTNKKTNGVGKSDETACNWVMQSALLQLQSKALELGGNAVINIESYYKKNVYRNDTQFECHAGAIMAGVALRGDVVKLK